MTGIAAGVELLRPAIIEFGSGSLDKLGQWARTRGARRTMVVVDGFNGNRADRLALHRASERPAVAHLRNPLAIAQNAKLLDRPLTA
jgi:alcohol dehydrogenase